MNIVTKSGTNAPSGSFFTLFRDTAMNSITETEEINEIEKQDYRRYQFGGSFGGPIVQDKAHFFAAVERTQQDTFQAVNTEGFHPCSMAFSGTPYRENLVTGKVTAAVTPSQYLSVRYGRNTNTQPYGASPQTPPNGWGTSENSFPVTNVNHNWVFGSRLNEFIFHMPISVTHIGANSQDPYQSFPGGRFRRSEPEGRRRRPEQKQW